MQVRCIRAFGLAKPGDLAEVPDGARMDPAYWEVIPDEPPPAPAPAPAPSAAAVAPAAPAAPRTEGV